MVEHGYRQGGSKSTHSRSLVDLRVRFGLRVRNIDRDPSKTQRPANTAASRALGRKAPEPHARFWSEPGVRLPVAAAPRHTRYQRTTHPAGLVRSAIASSTGCTSSGEQAITFNISAVAACCSRASFRSLLGSEIGRRLTRVAAGAVRRLVLAVLRVDQRCWLSPRSSCRPFSMAAPYLPPGSRRASYRARRSLGRGGSVRIAIARWPH